MGATRWIAREMTRDLTPACSIGFAARRRRKVEARRRLRALRLALNWHATPNVATACAAAGWRSACGGIRSTTQVHPLDSCNSRCPVRGQTAIGGSRPLRQREGRTPIPDGRSKSCVSELGEKSPQGASFPRPCSPGISGRHQPREHLGSAPRPHGRIGRPETQEGDAGI